MFIAVFTESVLFFILKAKCNTSCINYQTLFNFSLVYNFVPLLDMSNSIIVFFIRCSVIYVPLFNFNVIVSVYKETHAQLFEFLFWISNMLSDIVYCYIVPSITRITV
jgi:hypothetical protein